jgi:hypothetical protein
MSFEFKYSRTPTANLRVTASAESAAMGIQAVDEYRFGRPAPRKTYLKPSGPDFHLGSRNLGPAIQLTR